MLLAFAVVLFAHLSGLMFARHVGTRSVIFGAHCWFLHPWFVALGWWKLYGFPWDPRLWVAFFVHDLGYIGKPNMDGDEGEQHPKLGASIMGWAFDQPVWGNMRQYQAQEVVIATRRGADPWYLGCLKTEHVHDLCELCPWYQFSLLHSRYYAKALDMQPSPLCIADKYAIILTPWWLYLPMVTLSGEIDEYMTRAEQRIKNNEAVTPTERGMLTSHSPKEWYLGVQRYMRRWVEEHKDGRVDTWTARRDAV